MEEREPLEAAPKLYGPNAVVTFRLTKERDDVRSILNEKKAAGEDISQYLARVIRIVEGLATDTAAPSSFPAQPVTGLMPQLTDDQMNILVSRITQQLMQSGFQAHAQAPTPAIVEPDAEEQLRQQKKAELKNAAADMMEW